MTTVTMCLLALWVPATAHCQLEAILPAVLLPCADHRQDEPHQSADCQQDGCGVVESADYCLGTRAPLVTPPSGPGMAAWLAPTSKTFAALVEEPGSFAEPVHHPPPELATAWQFIWRTALSPRAPSFFV